MTSARPAAPSPGAAGPPDEIRAVALRVVYENPRVRVRRDDVVFGGRVPGDYTVIELPDFSVVVPMSADGGLWLVEQYRYPMGRRSWEFPQGTWPLDPHSPRVRAGEYAGSVRGDLAELARSELAEETGFRATWVTPLGRFYTDCGYSPQQVHVYLATGLRDGPPAREESEAGMRLRRFTRAEVAAMIAANEIVDIHTVAAFSRIPPDALPYS